MPHLNESSLEGKKTNFQGASWPGANIERIVNETKTHLPGTKELEIVEEKSNQKRGIMSYLSSLFNLRHKDNKSINIEENKVESDEPNHIEQNEIINLPHNHVEKVSKQEINKEKDINQLTK